MKREYSLEERKQRAFDRVAYVIRGMWEEKGSSDTSLLLPPLVPDDYVTVGESFLGKDHREHVIPRMTICVKCHEMLAAGASDMEVASFIRRHLKIVLIFKGEQIKLDGAKHHNLRQRMPDDWTFESGDIYRRLNEAGIKFRLYGDAVNN